MTNTMILALGFPKHSQLPGSILKSTRALLTREAGKLNPIGANHISFTVTDLDRSCRWYESLSELETVLNEEHETRRARVHRVNGSDLYLGLVEHATVQPGFDPTRVGLDAFGFRVATQEDMEAYASLFDR